MNATPVELDHFTEVFKYRNLTHASVSLGISQPALSQSLSRLEAKLKVSLFVRSKQGCVPTSAALVLFEKAARLKECWEEIETGVLKTQTSLSGRFRIGCHPSVGAYTLSHFFKSLHKAAPKIEISLQHGYSRSITDKIIHFEIDLGFVIGPEKHPELILTKIGKDRVCFWESQHHKDPPKILFTDLNPDQTNRLLRNRAASARFASYQKIETPSLELIRSLVNQGAGIGILPERVARADQNTLSALKDMPESMDEIYIAYRADTLRSLGGKAVIAAAKNSISPGIS